jgi:hypothetical protein
MKGALAVLAAAVNVAAAVVLGGCGDDGGNGAHTDRDAGTQDSGTDSPLDGPRFCPDPNDPSVHYLEVDPNRCQPDELSCTVDQFGFHNVCGCGCIDHGDPSCPDPQNPDVRYLSRDPAECSGTPACQLNELSFSNTCGCGCLLQG